VLKVGILLQWILPVNLKLLLYHLQQQAGVCEQNKRAFNWKDCPKLLQFGIDHHHREDLPTASYSSGRATWVNVERANGVYLKRQKTVLTRALKIAKIL